MKNLVEKLAAPRNRRPGEYLHLNFYNLKDSKTTKLQPYGLCSRIRYNKKVLITLKLIAFAFVVPVST